MGSVSSPSASLHQSLNAGWLGCHGDSCFQSLVFIFGFPFDIAIIGRSRFETLHEIELQPN